MGNNLTHDPESVPISADMLRELEKQYTFDEQELKQLWMRFQAIGNALTPDGLIDKTEFQQSLGYFNSNALVAHRLFHVFDQDANGTINFEEFVAGLSQICSDDLQTKAECVFFLSLSLSFLFILSKTYFLFPHIVVSF